MSDFLVTGTAGQIGSIETEFLVEKGYSVIGMDIFQEGKPQAVNTNITVYEGDFGNKLLLSKMYNTHNIEYVFHLAAETTLEYSMSIQQKYA